MRSAPDRTGSSVPVRRARPEVDFQINHSSFDVGERREHTNLHLSSVHLLLYWELPPLCCPFSTQPSAVSSVIQGSLSQSYRACLPPGFSLPQFSQSKLGSRVEAGVCLVGGKTLMDCRPCRIGLKTAGIDPFLIRSCRTDALPNHI